MPNISLEGRGKKKKCDFHSSYLMEKTVIFNAGSILQATENGAWGLIYLSECPEGFSAHGLDALSNLYLLIQLYTHLPSICVWQQRRVVRGHGSQAEQPRPLEIKGQMFLPAANPHPML